MSIITDTGTDTGSDTGSDTDTSTGTASGTTPPSPTDSAVTQARFAALPTEQLEAWICQMSANLAAAEHDWLVAIAEFDARNGWHAWGVSSCVHWLGWHVGLEQRTAREKLRVGHALRRFPAIAAAMASGQLSYSKVRALTRIASEQNEATLAMWALASTSNQVERIVAGYSRSTRSARKREQQQWDGRSLMHSTDDDGSITITLRLPADAAVEFLSAVEQFVPPPVPLDDGTREPRTARRADAAVHIARIAHSTTHNTTSSTTHDTVHQPGDQFAEPTDTPPTAKGAAAPLVTLHVDLDALLPEPDANSAHTNTADTNTADPADHHDSNDHHEGRTCHIEGAPGALAHPVAVSPATALRLLCGADVEALLHRAELPVGVTDRRALVRGRLRRHVLLRDSTCRYPDCTRAAALDVHHIRHRHHGGTNHTHNLVSLCAYHHRLVHEGGWRITGNPDRGVLTFISPAGHRVSSAPTNPPTGTAEAVLAKGRTPADGRSQWHGDRLDLHLAVLCLHQLDHTDRSPTNSHSQGAAPRSSPPDTGPPCS
ncbi:MAG: hypothetical protein RI900_32 [Actinomycetota bacterium]